MFSSLLGSRPQALDEPRWRKRNAQQNDTPVGTALPSPALFSVGRIATLPIHLAGTILGINIQKAPWITFERDGRVGLRGACPGVQKSVMCTHAPQDRARCTTLLRSVCSTKNINIVTAGHTRK